MNTEKNRNDIPLQLPENFKNIKDGKVLLYEGKADLILKEMEGEQKENARIGDIDVQLFQVLRPYGRLEVISKEIVDYYYRKGSQTTHLFFEFPHSERIVCSSLFSSTSAEDICVLQQKCIDVKYSNDNGNELSFALYNFLPLRNEKYKVIKLGTSQKPLGSYCSYFVELVDDSFEVLISQMNGVFKINGHNEEEEGLRPTHVGKITKKDRGAISWAEGTRALDCLRYFLSFARGCWQPIGNICMQRNNGSCICEKWGIIEGGALPKRRTNFWDSGYGTKKLSSIYSEFSKLWNNPLWRECFPEIIEWYLQANLTSVGELASRSALILSQATLEKLAWHYVVNVRKALCKEGFGKTSFLASDRFRILAALLDLPSEIPKHMRADLVLQNRNILDAFQAITEVRNCVVHAKPNNEFSPKAYFYAKSLSQWYIEMCLLRIMGCDDIISNRINWGFIPNK